MAQSGEVVVEICNCGQNSTKMEDSDAIVTYLHVAIYFHWIIDNSCLTDVLPSNARSSYFVCSARGWSLVCVLDKASYVHRSVNWVNLLHFMIRVSFVLLHMQLLFKYVSSLDHDTKHTPTRHDSFHTRSSWGPRTFHYTLSFKWWSSYVTDYISERNDKRRVDSWMDIFRRRFRWGYRGYPPDVVWLGSV